MSEQKQVEALGQTREERRLDLATSEHLGYLFGDPDAVEEFDFAELSLTCGSVGDKHLVEHSRLFQDNAEAVETLTGEVGK